MKILLLLLVSSFIFASCDGLDGVFSVDSEITVHYKDKIYEVTEGDHPAEFKYKDSKLTIKLKKYKDDGGDYKVKMMFPKGTTFPEENGEINLLAGDIGQSFDIQGDVTTDVTVSETQWGTQQCSYLDREYYCYYDGRNRICNWRTVTKYGRQEIWYHYVYKVKNVDVDFIELDTTIANFSATENNNYKVIERSTRCW